MISCYFFSNKPIGDFVELLESIGTEIIHISTEIILGGDLNAKASAIGLETTDARDRFLEEWLLSNRLIVLNEGNDPKYVEAGGTTTSLQHLKKEVQRLVTGWYLSMKKT